MERKEKTCKPYRAIALCPGGAEKVVSGELKKLDLATLDTGFGRVRFDADAEGLYRALVGLRAADRVLLEAGAFRAANFDELFDGTSAIPWEKLAGARLGVKVAKARSIRSRLSAETSIQAVAHKAIAQRLCKAHSLARLPETEEAAEVWVRVEKDEARLLLDLSGEPLFKRGYRKKGGAAPLRETVAAALLLLSGWKRKYPLHDPFCGSGTILAEALMYAWDMAPGLGRDFAISRLPFANRALEEKVRDEFRANVNFERTIRIAGGDSDGEAVKLAKATLESVAALAGTAGALPEIRREGAEDARPLFEVADGERGAGDPAGFVVTNPPYGKRLGDRAGAQKTYAEMSALAKPFRGWKLAVICDHTGFESFFGRKADSCREISCGPDPSYFFQYARL